MSTTIADLVVDVTANGASAVAGLDDVGRAAADMASRVDQAGAAAQDTGRRLSLSADQADDFAGKTGKATGALGALSSGFELVGLGDYATGLQSASMATDFLSGAGDSLNLIMESQAVMAVRAKVATAAQAVATRAAGIAARVAAAGQWVLNAALSANPIALVVIALAALAAGVIFAYKKSETFRRIVHAAFFAVTLQVRIMLKVVQLIKDRFGDAIGGAVHAVIDKGAAIVSWFARLPGKIGGELRALPGTIRDGISDALAAGRDMAGRGVEWVVTAIGKLPGKIRGIIGDIKNAGKDLIRGFIDGLANTGDFVSGIAGKVWDAVRGMINAAIRAVNNALSIHINKGPIHINFDANIPEIPASSSRPIVPAGRETSAQADVYVPGVGRVPGGAAVIIIQGAIDPVSTARQVRQLLTDAGRTVGGFL